MAQRFGGKYSPQPRNDEGYPGVVITLGKEFKAHRVDGSDIETGAACILAYVVRDAYSRGLGGMEFAVGIPGTVGGAISMNAGTGDAWIGSVASSVTVYLPGEGLTRLRAEEIDWAYRDAGLPPGAVVVEPGDTVEFLPPFAGG